MFNKELRRLALTAVLGSYLSNLDGSEFDPFKLLDTIAEAKGRYNWPDSIEIFEPFEAWSGERLSGLIEEETDARVRQFEDVAELIKGHLVTLAVDDLMPLDLNELDLRGWVKTGYGNELEGDETLGPIHTVGSSHGTLTLNKSGFVIGRYIECNQPCDGCIDLIQWFDLKEWADRYEAGSDLQNPHHFDILDLAGETDTLYFPADEKHRQIIQEEGQSNG
jgi:hypothetical protein